MLGIGKSLGNHAQAVVCARGAFPIGNTKGLSTRLIISSVNCLLGARYDLRG